MRDDVIPVAGKFLRCLWAYRLDLPRAVFIDGRYSNATLMTILFSRALANVDSPCLLSPICCGQPVSGTPIRLSNTCHPRRPSGRLASSNNRICLILGEKI